MVFIWI